MNPLDPENHELEAQLKSKLRPEPPPWDANRKVLEAFYLKDESTVKRQRRSQFFKHSWIAGLGLAATVVLTFSIFLQRNPTNEPDATSGQLSPIQLGSNPGRTVQTSPAPIEYEAVNTRNELLNVEDLGWRRGEDDSYVREYKYEYLDTVDMVNREDGSVMRVQIPREEIVNISYQVI